MHQSGEMLGTETIVTPVSHLKTGYCRSGFLKKDGNLSPNSNLKFWRNEIDFSQFTPKWFEFSKNDANIIWTSIKNTIFFKVTGVWLKNWACHAHLKFKIEMGMAGLVFEPHPPNFQNQYNFFRCTNDITMIFWDLYFFRIWKKFKSLTVQVTEVHALSNLFTMILIV